MIRKRITFDFETRSACDLKKAGAYKYSLHPSTRPTCLAFKQAGMPHVELLKFDVINLPWKDHSTRFQKQWEGWIREGFEFSAHNAFFEFCIYTNILVKRYDWPFILPRRYRCTAAKAAACALPRNLEGAGDALSLSVQKDKRGYVAMMSTCRPTKKWNAWKEACDEVAAGKKVGPKKRALARSAEPPVFLEYAHNPETWETLYTYCKIDVLAEEKLDDALPDLTPDEQEVWFQNQLMNWRGLRIDMPLIQKIVALMASENEERLGELDSLTMGLVTKPGARQAILDFLALEGIELPDIRAKTVEDAIKGDKLSPDMKRLLEIRQALSKTSTKKYQAFLNRANEDARVRDILLFHGASTGRDTGTGVQVQNLPRPLISQRAIESVISILEAGNPSPSMSAWLKFLYGENLGIIFSSLLRSMIIPSKGCELFVADFAKIEVAVLWWLADNLPGLAILNAGKDPYKYQAAANTGKRYDEIEDGGDERQLGKAQTLGCGFKMSWKRFMETAWSMYRLKLTPRQSFDAVKKYREANHAVVELWDIYEDAAIAAIELPHQTIRAGKCEFQVRKGFLWVTIPSGRKLAYKSPDIVYRAVTFTTLEIHPVTGEDVEVERTGEPRKTMQFQGLDMSKKNLRTEFSHGGILTENIVQAVARDLMKNGEQHLERAGYRVLLPVHDELLCEKKKGEGELAAFTKLMCTRPKWADSKLPLEAKGWVGMRYRK